MSTLKEIEVQNIDHLGIVAGMIDSIGLVEMTLDIFHLLVIKTPHTLD